LIIPIETGDRKIVLQHLLVVSDSMIIKHWREDWTYEDPIIWKYDGNKIWKKQELKPSDIKGRWTQSVWEVSDAPRYQGISEWVRTDGQLFWQNTTDAPLPRREYKVRKDYNILRRTNRIILNDSGWVHEQDNQKIIRNNGVDKLLVEEKGINSYRKIDDKHCAAAKQFWERNKNYWAHVRNIWNEYAGEHSLIELQTRVDGKVLHEYLDELLDQFSKGEVKEDALNEKIKILLSKFLSMHS
jgi:hypothetical protein